MALAKFHREKVKVAVLEDDAVCRELLVRLLGAMGAEVGAWSNGTEGLWAVFTDAAKPDLVVSDLHMEGIDGLAVLGALKGSIDPKIQGIPVVLFTAAADKDVVERAKRGGAACTLGKPFNPSSLSEVLSALVKKHDEQNDPKDRPLVSSDMRIPTASALPRILPR